MPLARCPKCGATFPNTLRECPKCGYSPFARSGAPAQTPQPPQSPQPPQGPPPQQATPRAQTPPPVNAVSEPYDEQEAEKSPLRRLILPIIAVVLGLALIAGGFFWMQSRKKNPAPPDPNPTYCAEGEHVWAEATCTEPKTCTVCGKTEGEPLGHEYEDNLCIRCGTYEKPFMFSGLSCRRTADSLVFSGAIRNYTAVNAKKIQLRLELFDENENLVVSDEVVIFDQDVVPALDSAKWRFNYDDQGLHWKYWRVSVINYIIEIY